MIKLSHVETNKEMAEDVKALVLAGKIGQSDVIEQFEDAFAKWVGAKYCIAVSSGTMADTIALAVLKQFNPKKTKVLVPALTFAAQVNSIIYNGLTPVFVDIDQGYNMEMVKALDIADRDTLCLFPAHLLGRPAFVPHGGNYRNIPIIEDSCEAMGSIGHNGAKCGTVGDLGTFSFFPSHTISTGEGGMIVTNDPEYSQIARTLRNHGKNSQADFHFNSIGFNGKITSIQAMIGIHALRNIDSIIERRRRAFFELGGKEASWEKVSPHAFPVVCGSREGRDRMLEQLRGAGVECRNLFSCLPTQEKAYSYLGHKPGAFPYAEHIGECGLYVPCHSGLSPQDIQTIKGILSEA